MSVTFGLLSIVAWLFAQLPQIWKNHSLKSTSGLSIFFLAEWCLGDLGNLLGALFTHQATWQVTIGAYYVFVDVCLVLQWFWYEHLQHGRHLVRLRTNGDQKNGNDGDGGLNGVIIEGVDPRPPEDAQERGRNATRPVPIFRTPTFKIDDGTETEKASAGSPATPGGTRVRRVGQSSSFASPSPRTVLMLACLIALAQASPLTMSLAHSMTHENTPDGTPDGAPSPLESVGTVLSWLSTVLYLGSRLPQLYKNWRRRSTAGLSPLLFAAAFCGNLFYSAAVATNPCAWADLGPHGGGGWAGRDGSDRARWTAAALPFFLGAAGVLALDASVGAQFLVYGEGDDRLGVIIEQEQQEEQQHEQQPQPHGARKWRWRRVSGWMRGWVPSSTAATGLSKGHEQRALLDHHDARGEGYGAL